MDTDRAGAMSGADREMSREASIAAVAMRLLDAYEQRALIERLVTSAPEFDIGTAYEVLHHIESDRLARGWLPVGRKLGFTNRTIWSRYGVFEPMWARIWDRTVTFAVDGSASITLGEFVQPRIEPEVVFKLARPPIPGSSAQEVLSCVEWYAAGFEIVHCHFPEWHFTGAECTADFGLHGALIIGTPVSLADRDLAMVAEKLATFKATLSRNGSVVARGRGNDVLDSPALALDHLARVLVGSAATAPLEAGELITTGTLVDPPPLTPGDRWTSNYGELGIAGIELTLTEPEPGRD